MKKTSVYLFNDRKIKMKIRILDESEVKETEHLELEPARGAHIPLVIGDGKVPFVKIWEDNSVLVSYINE